MKDLAGGPWQGDEAGYVCVCLCVCIINSLSCLNEKKWKKTWKKIKNENIDRKMLRRKNQLSVDENI